MKTINEEVIPVVDSIRPLNMSLTNVYPFASDKNLILTLEEQMRIEQKNIKETEKTGDNLFKLPNLIATRPLLIILTVALSALTILVILVVFYAIYRCRRNNYYFSHINRQHWYHSKSVEQINITTNER